MLSHLNGMVAFPYFKMKRQTREILDAYLDISRNSGASIIISPPLCVSIKKENDILKLCFIRRFHKQSLLPRPLSEIVIVLIIVGTIYKIHLFLKISDCVGIKSLEILLHVVRHAFMLDDDEILTAIEIVMISTLRICRNKQLGYP